MLSEEDLKIILLKMTMLPKSQILKKKISFIIFKEFLHSLFFNSIPHIYFFFAVPAFKKSYLFSSPYKVFSLMQK